MGHSNTISGTMKLLAVLFVAFVALANADDNHGNNAKVLKESTFKDAVAKGPHFVMFFAPWCGHCKRLAPVWDELAEDYLEDEKDVVIAKVDCTEEIALCSGQDVTGYPTLKFFKDGPESGVKHRGKRDQKSLERFIDEQMGRAPTEEEEEVPEPKAPEAEMAAEPEAPVVEDGLYILNPKAFKNHVAKGDTFVKFYAPWCGHCKKLAPTWADLAKKVDKDADLKVTVAKVDCTKAQDLCQAQEVRGYPTLAYFRKGEKVETYSGARSLKELYDFLHAMTADKASGGDSKAAEPTEAAPESVAALNGDNFKESIAGGVTFVKFFAPWCGHCKRLAPIWTQLADKYADVEGVTIAKVDCTSDGNKNKQLCNTEGVNGFPTLNIYRDGEKVEEYNGKRGLDQLAAFVDKHATKEEDVEGRAEKDEL